MSVNEDNARKVKSMTRAELESRVLRQLNSSENDRLRKQANRRDEQEAEAELAGQEQLPIEMPTLLDAHVRVQNDDGGIDWKTRDEASTKDHLAYHDYRHDLHIAAAGIRDRKRDKLSDWAHDQGGKLDHEGPIGDYVWQHVRCCICGYGPEKIPTRGPFVQAHYIAHKVGGTETQFAHQNCNLEEGVG